MNHYEEEAFADGCTYVAGLDEVGRGPLAGPVVTAAVVIDKDFAIEGINDSKKLSAKKRDLLFDAIMEDAIAVQFGIIGHQEIDEINILNATKKAMTMAVHALPIPPDRLLVDALRLEEIAIPQKAIVKGDAKSIAIAAASIVAKVKRDAMMVMYDAVYPAYGFAKNKGYGTAAHIQALKQHGPCPIHRTSFIKNIVEVKS